MTAVRDGARFLGEALESALAQTFTDFELIVWDDGSTDDSFAIASAFAARDPRIRAVRSAPLGLRVVRPETVALARGRFVGWLDADDRLDPHALERTTAVLERHPDCGMVFTDYLRIDAGGRVLGPGRANSIPYSPHRLLVDLMTLGFRLFRRELYAVAGGLHPGDVAMDYDFCLRMSERARIHRLAEPLYHYRRHGAQISRARRAEQIEASAGAVRAALERRGLSRSHALRVEAEGRFRLVPREIEKPAPRSAVRALGIAAKTIVPALRRIVPRSGSRSSLLRLGYWPHDPGDAAQRRLYEAALQQGLLARPLGSDLVSLMRAVWRGRAGDVLHIRDTAPLRDGANEAAARANALMFRRTLDHALARGVDLIWTVGQVEDRDLAERASIIIACSQTAAARVPAPHAGKVRVVPHPHFLDMIPEISRAHARAVLGRGLEEALFTTADAPLLELRAADVIVVSGAACTEAALARAMSLGRPLVAPALPLVRELLPEGNYLAREDAECDRAAWDALGLRNLERVRRRSWDDFAAALRPRI